MSPPTAATRTERLVLRRPEPVDLDAVWRIHSDPETNRFNPAGPIETKAQAAAMLDAWIEHWAAHGFGYWAVAEIGDPADVIGFGGLIYKAIAGREQLNLYFRFQPSAWGKGYAAELACASADLAFRDLGADEIVATVRRSNRPSIKVLERLGMTPGGELEDAPPAEPSLLFKLTRP